MNTFKKYGALVLTSALCLLPSAFCRGDSLNQFGEYSVQEMARYGWTHRGVFDASNFTSVVTTLFPVPGQGTYNFDAGTQIERVAVKLIGAFNTGGTGAVSAALSIGDSTITNRYINVLSVGTNAGTGVLTTNLATGLITYNVTTPWNLGTTNHWRQIYNTATNLTLSLTLGSSETAPTSGRIEVYLRAVPLNKGSSVP